MRVNVNHPSFVSFMDNVSSSVLFNVVLDNYFTLSQDKRLALQYQVFLLTKNAINLRAKLSNEELRSFIEVLWRKSEESENYEFASILCDIVNNFDSICEVTKPTRRVSKSTKTDKTKNG